MAEEIKMVKKLVKRVAKCKPLIEKETHGLYRVFASPYFWRQKAEQLKHATDIILPELDKHSEALAKQIKKKDVSLEIVPPSLHTSYLGLLGFSIECLFKACIIRDNPTHISQGRQNKIMKTHNLLQLADLGQINLSNNEKWACELLSETMYVDFRYPVDQFYKPHRNISSPGVSVINISNALFVRIYPTVSQLHFAKGGEAPTKLKSSNFKPILTTKNKIQPTV
jgi:hypothetical protein